MQYQIWRHSIQILSFRNDLIDTIKRFFIELNNNNNNNKEKYNINEQIHIPFLKSLSSFQLKILYKYKIIDEEIYSIVGKQRISTTNSSNDISETSNKEEKMVKEIIEGDKIEELRKLIMEKDIKAISPITKSLNEVEKMKIPIIIECIIEKATKCFKYLLINGIEDPANTIQEQNPERFYDSKTHQMIENIQYEWDCMAGAIYYGEMEIVKILEEKGIEKGNNPAHIEAALLSYRNAFAKEIIKEMKEKNKNEENTFNTLKIGLNASIKSNYIKGAEILINNGAKINAKDIIYQIMITLFLIKII